MTSRTPEGKHTKRFIVLEKNAEGKFVRSTNIPKFYESQEAADLSVTSYLQSNPLTTALFKVRQK